MDSYSFAALPRKVESIVNSTNIDATTTTRTSVVSSSFHMTITAMESLRRRNLALLRRGGGGGLLNRNKQSRALEETTGATSHRQLREQQQPPLLRLKEEPAIVEHLARVYGEVLTLAPAEISLVFEGDLDAESIGADAGRDAGGVVIRKCVFRVVGE